MPRVTPAPAWARTPRSRRTESSVGPGFGVVRRREAFHHGRVQTRERFLDTETLAGLALIAATAAALVLANSPLSDEVAALFQTRVAFSFGETGLAKPLLLWVNDGLMALFFLLIGLELKREVLEGELSRLSQVALPGVAAIAGMAVPALVYIALTRGDPVAARGWAIPAATDIAFALGVLGLAGRSVPTSLRTFLMTLAVFDDIGAILIIAIFYSGELSMTAHVVAGLLTLVLVAMNRLGVTRLAAYFVVGIVLWVAVLKSGVHATIAGVVLGLAIPLRASDAEGHSPLRHLEHGLHPWVAFLVLPLFALANAGVDFRGAGAASLGHPVALGAGLGLLVGKSVGVFGAALLMVRLGWASLPRGASWGTLAGVACLAGIGFTMSLFVGSLAFEGQSAALDVAVRIGVLGGSLLAALLGLVVLRTAHRRAA
jgi:NhaA family Na+:H+ antiporter